MREDVEEDPVWRSGSPTVRVCTVCCACYRRPKAFKFVTDENSVKLDKRRQPVRAAHYSKDAIVLYHVNYRRQLHSYHLYCLQLS